MRVFITGVTGLIGQALAAALSARGDDVVGLSRRPAAAPPPTSRGGSVELVAGDPTAEGPWMARVAGCAAVIHLAGESIGAHRFSPEHKRRVRESRVVGTRNVVAAITTAPADRRPRVLVCASGADYYPFDESERAYDEAAPAGTSFLAEVCVAWEREAATAGVSGARVVSMRQGLALARGAVALSRMLTPFKLFLGGPIGSGRQWFSWIHLEDVVGGYLHAVDRPEVVGPVNLVAPGVVRQRDFARALGKVLRRPAAVPVPGFAVRLAAGELAEYLLHGRRVVPAALAASGYAFRLPEVSAALAASV